MSPGGVTYHLLERLYSQPINCPGWFGFSKCSMMFLTSLFFVREMTKRKGHVVSSQQMFVEQVNERTTVGRATAGSRGSDSVSSFQRSLGSSSSSSIGVLIIAQRGKGG